MYHVEDENDQIWLQYVKTPKVPEPEMAGRTITTLRNDDPRLVKKCTSSSEEILHIEDQLTKYGYTCELIWAHIAVEPEKVWE